MYIDFVVLALMLKNGFVCKLYNVSFTRCQKEEG